MAGVAAKKQECQSAEIHLCNHCEEDGKTIFAKIFCFSCQKYLCCACEKHHEKFFRNHKVAGDDKMPNEEGQWRFIPCDKHPKDKVEFYCQKDNEVFCKYCKVLRHKTCEVQNVADVCSDAATVKECNAMCDAMKEIKSDLEINEEKRQSNLDRMLNEAEEHRSMLRKLREDIGAFFDRYESYLDKHCETVKEKLNKHDHSNYMDYVHIAIEKLENAIETERRDEMFVHCIKAKQICKEYRESVAHWSATKENPVQLDYQDESLVSLINRLMDIADGINFGSDAVAESDSENKAGDLSFWKMDSPSLITETDIPLKKDGKKPYISGCCFVADSHVILCDSANRRVLILDQALGYKCELSCRMAPFDITHVDGKSAVVTIPEAKNIQYMSVYPVVRFGRKFQLNFKCYGIAFHKNLDEIYVSASDSVKILTLSGKEIRTVSHPDIYGIRYIALNKDATRMYFTIYNSPAIGCMSDLAKPRSKLMFQYSEFHKSPQSLAVDAEGNVLACDYGLGCLRVIKAQGTNGTSILTDKMLKPSSLSYDSRSKSLFVTVDKETSCTVGQYKLETR